ncbi:tyrosine-type recombinase/integrase [Rhizobium laguerreae]|uniref:tyrosine-type recombinase/integrase n=1 Tax=Rhizobium laguerreae TaxID=1076926 RepID=UPI001C9014A6|nr:integrase arm-type DNA-binding domain-containing protein [Rhizobium laguerreae]MBY3389158.1 integrase arm-type DNA-binding domain-containing protein [Rhizobium laguerreae]MBY3402908.1 integrase arm-type DNA-binding domain-containing protein [Rhizobium laguerreae]MBY3409847.1 integrase arm-type DNA-binding domain-containing protein [Rhizobium laguerreae]
MTKKRPHKLTDERIAALPAPNDCDRYDVPDGLTANLFVRVGRRRKVFIMSARFGGAKNTTRLSIGVFPEMTLDAARVIAEEWNRQVGRGLNPKKEKESDERLERLKTRRTFRSAINDYLAYLPYRAQNRHAAADAAAIRHDILDPSNDELLDRPVSEVTDGDLHGFIRAIRDRPSRAKAMAVLGHLRTFFSWATSPDLRLEYGLATNPMSNVTAKRLELKKGKRRHRLNALEVRAYWLAADAMPYPYGPYFKSILLFGGRRKSEVVGARWSEIDATRRVWIIPADRRKLGDSLGDLTIPLTLQATRLLDELRQNQCEGHGDCIFSTTNGQLPISAHFSRRMKIFRAKVEAELQKLEPLNHLRPFVLHDTRRVVRSGLSAIGVTDSVAEYIIGHKQTGMDAIYNVNDFLPQSRLALKLFSERLLAIVDGSALDWVDDPAEEEIDD